MKKLIFIIFLIGISCAILHFSLPKNETKQQIFTLEELTGVSKWIILEGAITGEHEEEDTHALTGKHIYINSKYKFGYAINTKDVLITPTEIIADVDNIYLDYIETVDTDIFSKYGWFAKEYSLSEIEGLKQDIKNKIRIQLYNQDYYNEAYANLINNIREEINYVHN